MSKNRSPATFRKMIQKFTSKRNKKILLKLRRKRKLFSETPSKSQKRFFAAPFAKSSFNRMTSSAGSLMSTTTSATGATARKGSDYEEEAELALENMDGDGDNQQPRQHDETTTTNSSSSNRSSFKVSRHVCLFNSNSS